MLKLFFLGLNFLNLFNYQVIVEEVTKYDEIIYQDEFYIIYLDDNIIKLKTTNDEWIRELAVTKNINVFLVDKDLYIFDYKTNTFKCIVYGIDGKVKLEKEIFQNAILNYEIKFHNNNFYVVGSINNYTDKIFTNVLRDDLALKDGFLLELDKSLNTTFIKTYGGILNEEFFNIVFTENCIYIAGKKDVLASGDFGNGGKNNGDIFIVKLGFDKNILDILVINDVSKIVNMFYYKDNIYLASTNYLYKLSPDIKNVLTNKIPTEAYYVSPSSFNRIVVIGRNKNYIYDFLNLRLLDELINEKEIINIKEFKNTFYIKSDCNYYFDIASLENLLYFDEIYSEYSPVLEIKTIFGEATYTQDLGDIVFDKTVYGTYLRKLKFINSFGTSFIIQRESLVRRQANISEGGIYPIGYNLLFTGRGYLNGSSIANNYSVSNKGDYTLKLVGANNEEYIINFKVDNEQISFLEEKVTEYNLLTNKGEIYFINLKYTSDIEEIFSVTIDGEDNTNILVNKNDKTISVKMNSISVDGIYYHVINSINYKENEHIRQIKVEKIFVLNVLKDVMKLDINKVNDYEYKFNLEDENTARYFLVSYIYNNQEYSYKYPLSTCKVYFDVVPEKENLEVSIAIYYDLGDKSYKRQELMNLVFNKIDANNILEIDVLKKEETLGEFVVKVTDEEALELLKINDLILFQRVKKDYFLHYIIGIMLLLVTGFGIYKIRYAKYKNKIGI